MKTTDTRIVVCDDEAHITRAISMKLRKAGFNVETADDGQAALEAVHRETPAMLITDLQMPRMNGIELSRRLRSVPETHDLPIIMLTAKGFEVDENELNSEIRLSRLMPKPFSPRELLQTVQQILDAVEPARN